MKIKLQAGGVVSYTPFIPNSETSTSSSKTSKTSEAKKDKITGTLQEEIIKVLKENGLQSDVDAFLGVADSLLIKSSSLSSMSLFGGTDDNYTMSHLINVLSLANKVKRNKEQWTNAVAQLKDQGAAHEVAMSSDGGIYVRTEEGLKSISPEEYYNNKDKYQGRAITNSQLLGLREMDPNLAFNFDILSDVSGSIGMKTISDTLVDIISKFGNNTLQGYVQKTGENVSKSIWDGMQALINNGPDGYYKAKSKSEKDDVTNAVKYLWRSLGSDGQKRLAAETAISGGNPNKDYIDIILEAFNLHTDYELTAEFDKPASDFDPKFGGKDNESTVQVPMLTKFANGSGEADLVTIAPRSSEINLRGQAVMIGMNFGNMIGFDENTLPMMSVGALRNKAEYFKAAFNQDVTFGNQLLKPTQEHAVLWDGTSQVAQVWLPYTYNNGQITPDFDLFFRYQAYVADCDKNPNMSDLEKNELLKKHRLVGKVTPVAGSDILELKDTMCFMTFSAYAHEDNIEMTDGTMRMTESVPKEEGKQIAQLYENASKYGSTTPGKNDENIYGFDSMNGWLSRDSSQFRKGNVFIPIKSSFLGTYASMKELISKDKVNRFDVRAKFAKLENGRTGIKGQFVE